MEGLNNIKVNDIIIDIMNHLNYELDSGTETKWNEIIHIDNLREKIKENPENFIYSIEEFNFVFDKLFN